MSLTQAIALNEDGSPFKNFSDWQERAILKKKTIFDALDEYTKPSPFNFGINHDFIYRISDRYHFVPSVEDLYWTELEFFDREKVKHCTAPVREDPELEERARLQLRFVRLPSLL
jgi:chromosome partitioning protein